MRHFRNPRFAPESLERKLNPSTPLGPTVMVEVAVEVARATDSKVATVTVDYGMDCRTAEAPLSPNGPTHPMPGDPEPLDPPPGSTDPGPGNGTPPLSDPSLPGGGGGGPA